MVGGWALGAVPVHARFGATIPVRRARPVDPEDGVAVAGTRRPFTSCVFGCGWVGAVPGHGHRDTNTSNVHDASARWCIGQAQ
jgi:hypothetical protein